MLTSPGNLPHLRGPIVEVEARPGVSALQQYLRCCPGAAASYQYYTLWRIPGAVHPSVLVQTVGLLPGAGAGEGVACCGSSGRCLGRRGPFAATHGQPCLCVVCFSVSRTTSRSHSTAESENTSSLVSSIYRVAGLSCPEVALSK